MENYMEKKDIEAVSEFAGLVNTELSSVDNKMLGGKPTSKVTSEAALGPAIFNRKPKQNINIVPKANMIVEQRSTPRPSEVVGIETVNLKDLLIHTNDKALDSAIKKYSSPQPTKPPQAVKATQVNTQSPEMTIGKIELPNSINNLPNIAYTSELSEMKELFKTINTKLDLILKYAKVKPKYKK